MKRKVVGKAANSLEEVRRRFEKWRRTRTARTRIPEPLWKAAVEAANENGLHHTAKTLRVDYYSLKKRMTGAVTSREGAKDRQVTNFVELIAPLATGAGERLLEMENQAGTKMRVSLNGLPTADVIALARSLWEARP